MSLSHHKQVCLIRLRFDRYLPSSGKVNDYIAHIFIANMQTRTETLGLANLGEKKLWNATN